MSFEASAWALKAECSNATEKAVLFVVTSYVGQDGTCYPSQKTIAQYSGCSPKSVLRALSAFEERGWIKRKERRRRDGSRSSDLIVFTAISHPEQPETQVDTQSPCENTKVTHSHGGGDTQSPLTTFEPAIESVSFKNTKKPNLFDEFWSLMPKKVAKAAAEKSYTKALKKIDHETLVGHLEQHVNAGLWSDLQFGPNPASWLNGERWTDDVDAIRARSSRQAVPSGNRQEPVSMAGLLARQRGYT